MTQITILIVLFGLLESTCRGDYFDADYIVLLHGLARSKQSMSRLEARLSAEGFRVLNIDYPSRSKGIQALAEETIKQAILCCRDKGAKKIHFVTHSMGGILVRCYLKQHDLPELGRVVMLSPPNGGSEVVDMFRDWSFFRWVNGPAGEELGTDQNSLPKKLGPVDFELGVITGDRSLNLLLSCIIPGPDDGKVSVRSAKVKGMKDFLVIHTSHPFIMQNLKVIEQTAHFLKQGKFIDEPPKNRLRRADQEEDL
ncbi:MAG: alpha/beta fold hydrolase [Desulfatiglans sp.]|jgi:hypothetical protein|nr:alpha/beta fold hydrolase [Thermodesulfobacteriota bacterium]MEE4351522.1 alpha/beta fold hydrolase [Desulfatiglans sp.]